MTTNTEIITAKEAREIKSRRIAWSNVDAAEGARREDHLHALGRAVLRALDHSSDGAVEVAEDLIFRIMRGQVDGNIPLSDDGEHYADQILAVIVED